MSMNDDKLIFNCPSCGKKLGVAFEKAGASALCPSCRKRISIPKSNKSK